MFLGLKECLSITYKRMNATLHTLEKGYFYFIEYSRRDLKVVGKYGY